MSRQDAMDQYDKALKQGQKCYRTAVLRGEYPYTQVLDEILGDSATAGTVELGLVEIPADQIVGTKEAGRKSAFASNFMPLLDRDTEFGNKWIQLCMAHLGSEGIRDPILCYEYLGRFYVQEGNKRVSVLRSYEASTIPGYVIRLVPPYSQDPKIQVYYEFMAFYQLAGLYQIRFTQLGSYAKLQAALGFDADHVWTVEERRSFLSRFSRFRDFFKKAGGEDLDVTVADALLVWLRVYTFQELKDMNASELTKSLQRVWPDVKLLSNDAPITINTQPLEPEKGILSSLFSSKLSHLNVAFLFQAAPKDSAFTRSHELGAEYVEKVMGDRVTVRKYYDVKPDETGDWVMEKAVAEGAQVIIATAPPLIGACRKTAAHHPEVRVLNCALSLPYAGVRTYYSRIYEGKFIAGAICAAMARENTMGYVASYPILGVPASINAFALGARMINPDARIQLEWSCVEGDPYEAFLKNNVRTITNREIPAPDSHRWAWDWGTFRMEDTGNMTPIASPSWNWGKFYEKVLASILNGDWDALASKSSARAVGYWWGMDSGVADVTLAPDLPDGLVRLAGILKRGIISGSVEPFGFRMIDQNGVERSNGDRLLSPEEIMNMDYLLDCVDGHIPAFDELRPIAQKVVRVLGIYRDQIPPEKEGVIL